APPAAGVPHFSGMAGRFILSADRLFSVTTWSAESATDQGLTHTDGEGSGTMVNLLWSNSAMGNGNINPYAIPRLSFDAFLGPRVTLGGSIGYISTGGSNKGTVTQRTSGSFGSTVTQTISSDLPDVSVVLFTPRLGVVLPASPNVSFWL